jgi:hypothetical protein
MDDIKAAGAEQHEQAASLLDLAAQHHRNAAKQCLSGNFPKAHSLAISASETVTAASDHALKAVDHYRHHAEEVAEHKAEAAAEQAARAAKHEAKAAS